jgi:polyphosphate kinase 2 (PPK2 family)
MIKRITLLILIFTLHVQGVFSQSQIIKPHYIRNLSLYEPNDKRKAAHFFDHPFAVDPKAGQFTFPANAI